MRFYILIVALMSAGLFFSCDGENKVYIPDPRKTAPDSTDWQANSNPDSNLIQLSPSEPEQVALENRQLIINVADVVGGDAPTDVTVKVHFDKGEISSYTVTTSASKPRKTKKSDTCAGCYVIQSGDTKTSLAKKFGIRQDQIKNKVLKAGEILTYE